MISSAIYIRKSREDATKAAHRLTAQREQLPAHAKTQGWTVEIYDDGHASAARGKTEDLTQRSRLETDIKHGKINIILCIELSRLSRDDSMQDYVAWLHLCSEHNVKLATPSRVLDPGQPSDWMLLLMEGGFSSVEMKILQKRMAEGRLEAIRAGKYIAGNPPPPYLYDKAKGGLIVDEATNQKMQKLFAMAPTSTIREMAWTLDMPTIAVRRALTEDRLMLYQAKRRDPVTHNIIPCEWPAVLDTRQAQKILTSRKTRPGAGPRRKAAGLLSNLNGIMVCGYCGGNLRGQQNSHTRKDGTRINYYACQAKDINRTCRGRRWHPQHIVDDKVITNLVGTLERIDELQYYWEQAQNTDNPNQLTKLEQQEARLLSQKKRLIAAIAEEVIEFADAKDKRLEIEIALNQVRNEIETIKNTRDAAPDWSELQFTGAEIDALNSEEKRELITLTIASIRVFKKHLLIDYRFPRDPSGNPTSRVHLPDKGRTNPRGHYKLNPKK